MDLERVDKITTGAVGEPGQRTFFIQAREGDRLVTILVEKEQVELLATSILEILASVDLETGEGPSAETLELEPPLEPFFRAGRLSIGYAEERDLMLLEMEELVEGEELEPDEDDEEPVRAAGRGGRGPTPGASATVGDARADAGAVPPRPRGRRPRASPLPVLRQPDGPGGTHLPGHERPPGDLGTVTGAALGLLERGDWSCWDSCPDRRTSPSSSA